jgi:hypothetical protein
MGGGPGYGIDSEGNGRGRKTCIRAPAELGPARGEMNDCVNEGAGSRGELRQKCKPEGTKAGTRPMSGTRVTCNQKAFKLITASSASDVGGSSRKVRSAAEKRLGRYERWNRCREP